jgi:hypothetical protein
MPLYFFDFNDDELAPGAPDTTGTDLPSLASVPGGSRGGAREHRERSAAGWQSPRILGQCEKRRGSGDLHSESHA